MQMQSTTVGAAPSPEFAWPCRNGTATETFSESNNSRLELSAKPKSPGVAIAAGVVANAGEMKGMGNVLFLRHLNGFTSAYSGLGVVTVKSGATVAKGQVVGAVGASGKFAIEMRKGETIVDPRNYLHPSKK
jgi:murein DD-endopeptidase MepM/ murein hydrolase activator NlpD